MQLFAVLLGREYEVISSQSNTKNRRNKGLLTPTKVYIQLKFPPVAHKSRRIIPKFPHASS